MDISVVIPLYNEAESLPELFAWIERVMKEHNFSYEVIFINDGSTDNSWEVIEALKSKNPEVVHAVKFRRNYGKSPGLNCGFQRAKGDVVITMDADLQDSPDEIPELYRMITEDGYDLVSGWKKKRYDPLSKTIPTKLFNATARKFSGITNLHDFNCGLKAYKNIVIKNIEIYNDMHRYIPYLANDKVRTEPLCKRLPGPDHPLVHLQIRQEADAFLRIMGKRDVFHRFHRTGHCVERETDFHLYGRFATTGHQLTLLLCFANSHDPRNADVPRGIHRRTDFKRFT